MVIAQHEAGRGVPCTCVSDGLQYRAILQAAAKKECDLIYRAAHGRTGASALVLGSETVKVLTHGSAPVWFTARTVRRRRLRKRAGGRAGATCAARAGMR